MFLGHRIIHILTAPPPLFQSFFGSHITHTQMQRTVSRTLIREISLGKDMGGQSGKKWEISLGKYGRSVWEKFKIFLILFEIVSGFRAYK